MFQANCRSSWMSSDQQHRWQSRMSCSLRKVRKVSHPSLCLWYWNWPWPCRWCHYPSETKGSEAFSFSYLCEEKDLRFRHYRVQDPGTCREQGIGRKRTCFIWVAFSDLQRQEIKLKALVAKCMYNLAKWILEASQIRKSTWRKPLKESCLSLTCACRKPWSCTSCASGLSQRSHLKVGRIS